MSLTGKKSQENIYHKVKKISITKPIYFTESTHVPSPHSPSEGVGNKARKEGEQFF